MKYQPAVPPGLTLPRALLIAYYHMQLFVYGGVTPSSLLAHPAKSAARGSGRPQKSIRPSGSYRNPTACGSL